MRANAINPQDVAQRLPSPGIGTRQQWLAAGATDRMFRDGRLTRFARGLYCDASISGTELARRTAAMLPDDAVVGGWLAAVLHGVREAAPGMPGASSDLAVCYLARHNHKRPPGFRSLRCDLLAGEIEIVEGVRVTSPIRTAYDMARFSTTLAEAVAVLDTFAWEGNSRPITRAELADVIECRPKSKGNPRARSAGELMNARSRSAAESRLRTRWVRECGIDPSGILVNPTLCVDGYEVEVDLVDIASGLVGEYDGPSHADPNQRSRDARKDALIDQAGLVVQRYNAPELRLEAASFARLVGVRRSHAIDRGGRGAAWGLAARGELLERPMTIYSR